jgi:hypothetical protein
MGVDPFIEFLEDFQRQGFWGAILRSRIADSDPSTNCVDPWAPRELNGTTCKFLWGMSFGVQVPFEVPDLYRSWFDRPIGPSEDETVGIGNPNPGWSVDFADAHTETMTTRYEADIEAELTTGSGFRTRMTKMSNRAKRGLNKLKTGVAGEWRGSRSVVSKQSTGTYVAGIGEDEYSQTEGQSAWEEPSVSFQEQSGKEYIFSEALTEGR